MNNNNINNFINLYGGNDNITEYTSSVLNKYNIINKFQELFYLLIDSESDNIINLDEIKIIDNNNLIN